MKVCDGGEQVEAQSETLAAVAISAAENAKAFQVPQHVFDADAARSQVLVLLFWGRRQGVMLAFFVRGMTVAMQFSYALIARVGQQRDTGWQCQATVFEQGKVMRFAHTGGHT
jgi:hypothetical protein